MREFIRIMETTATWPIVRIVAVFLQRIQPVCIFLLKPIRSVLCVTRREMQWDNAYP